MSSRHNRDLVRRGYDAMSRAYRDDSGQPAASTREDVDRYAVWIDELAGLLKPGARVLDLGCGNGLPVAKLLVNRGFEIVGLDFSAVQIDRARYLVPAARFVHADMTAWSGAPESFDAVACFYALIHVPLMEQRRLIPRIASWLRPGGFLMAIVGAERWRGVEDYLGVPMFWDHADSGTYLSWLEKSGLQCVWHRSVPEGTGRHVLVLARRVLALDSGLGDV